MDYIGNICSPVPYRGTRNSASYVTASLRLVPPKTGRRRLCHVSQTTSSSPSPLVRLFGPLESLGVECDVRNALSHLRSAKQAFLEAKHEREVWKQHQTSIVGLRKQNSEMNFSEFCNTYDSCKKIRIVQ